MQRAVGKWEESDCISRKMWFSFQISLTLCVLQHTYKYQICGTALEMIGGPRQHWTAQRWQQGYQNQKTRRGSHSALASLQRGEAGQAGGSCPRTQLLPPPVLPAWLLLGLCPALPACPTWQLDRCPFGCRLRAESCCKDCWALPACVSELVGHPRWWPSSGSLLKALCGHNFIIIE